MTGMADGCCRKMGVVVWRIKCLWGRCDEDDGRVGRLDGTGS